MANNNLITIPKKAVEKRGGFVILSLKEYEKLREETMPTYHLSGKKAKELDKLIREGKREYKAGKCKEIKSLADLD